MVGACSACASAGREGRLVARKNPRSLKRFIRCENYEECGTSYPLPQYGKIEATGESCPDCGAPMVVVVTQRGPWKLCPNFSCPGKERRSAEKEAKKKERQAKGKTAGSVGKPRAKKSAQSS